MSSQVIEQSSHCADEVLVALIAQRDTDALAILYDRHASAVLILLLGVTHDLTMANELLQDTFWQIWQKADQFEGRGSVAAWLTRIARNKALDQLRRQRSRSQAHDIRLDDCEHAVHSQSAEREAERRWMGQSITTAFAKLPSAQRLCLEMAYFDGFSEAEIAVYTHAPLGTIKTRLRIGKAKVKRMLCAVGYGESNLPSLA